MPGLRVPEQYQIIDVEDQGSGSLSGFGDSVLRIFKAEELLHVAEADLQWPAQSKGFQYLRRFQEEVGREEAIVAAPATGIADHNNTQQPGSGAGIPQRVYGLLPDLDLAAIQAESCATG